MIFRLILLLCSAVTVFAAQYDPPNRYAWSANVNVGVPGGIPTTRTNIINVTEAPYNADNTGVTDATTAINTAIGAAASGDIVYLPAGTYKIESTIYGGYKDNYTIRGAGMTLTTLNYTAGTGPVISVGGDSNYQWLPHGNVTGSPAAGDTTMGIGDTSLLEAGRPMLIYILNNQDNTAIEAGSVPVISTRGYERTRRQMVRISSKTSSTVTFFPALAFALPTALEPKVSNTDQYAEGVGVEDLMINMNASSTPHGGLAFEQSYACWALRVAVRYAPNYHIVFNNSVNCEVRRCDARWRQGFPAGSNGAGLLFGSTSASLVEDSIFTNTFPLIEVNGGSTANVFAYNFIQDVGLLGSAINTNHNPHNSFNLYEGNITPNFQCDGYFGGASEDTLFRNWITNVCSSTEDIRSNGVILNRWTRNYNVVGNVIGTNGLEAFLYGLGYPYIGNSEFSGTQEMTASDFSIDWKRTAELTARPNDTTGTVTLDGTTSIITGQNGIVTMFVIPIDPSPNPFGSPYLLEDVVVSAPDISFTVGGALPSLTTEFTIFPGPGGFPELDLDVENSTIFKGNYNTNIDGIPAGESLAGDTLANSYFRSVAPSGWGSLTWPPFDPTVATPNMVSTANPAGYYFVNGVWPDDNTVGTPIFNPVAGTYPGTQNITISSSTSDVTFYYTVDGSTPTDESTLYSGPVAIASTLTLKAIGTKVGMTDSSVASGLYTITTGGPTLTVTGTTTVNGTLTLP